ncbi:hypothetical protein PENSPDRAFT_671988 [Peniophora sp. CONT]|nr:hypothetical protein PENSPDRAFT_671988 [Peniophora sp. CONT]
MEDGPEVGLKRSFPAMQTTTKTQVATGRCARTTVGRSDELCDPEVTKPKPRIKVATNEAEGDVLGLIGGMRWGRRGKIGQRRRSARVDHDEEAQTWRSARVFTVRHDPQVCFAADATATGAGIVIVNQEEVDVKSESIDVVAGHEPSAVLLGKRKRPVRSW